MAHDRSADPQRRGAGRFNIPWVVAAALTTGRLQEDSFGDDAMRDAATIRLAHAVTVQHDEALDVRVRDGRPAEVVVRLDDGRWLSARTDTPIGDGPLPAGMARDKAERLLGGRFGVDGSRLILEAVDALNSPDSRVQDLSQVLRAEAGRAAAPVDSE